MEHYYFLICWKQNLNFKLCFSLDYADDKRASQVQFQVQKVANTFMESVLENLGQRPLKTIIVIIRECGVEEMEDEIINVQICNSFILSIKNYTF